jgi:5-methylcytosine-specific restriction endonuclease McrA
MSFSTRCKACEQKLRNEKKNEDRARAIVEQRARTAATKAEQSFPFFWEQMNYKSLVAPLRAFMSPEGTCQACGPPFVNERDVQIEHIEPQRTEKDWARLHARNLRFTCGSCNRAKGRTPYNLWLDEQEDARLSNLVQPTGVIVPSWNEPVQGSLWSDATLRERTA